jgi:uncharacterized protein
MPVYFADTSFWVALVDRRDSFHGRAIQWSANISGSIITTEAVLLETANTFCKPHWRSQVIALIDHIRQRQDIEILKPAWEGGWKMFANRPDKSWSLTDCISFQLMQEKGLTNALAADSHFQQAGFHALLLDPL